nr:uncharacterized protein CI109_006266 [Kwoniella shandongensis]KAA5525367.1 hypothetical protein CI109_006266 [Kwoniella shandongensis]
MPVTGTDQPPHSSETSRSQAGLTNSQHGHKQPFSQVDVAPQLSPSAFFQNDDPSCPPTPTHKSYKPTGAGAGSSTSFHSASNYQGFLQPSAYAGTDLHHQSTADSSYTPTSACQWSGGDALAEGWENSKSDEAHSSDVVVRYEHNHPASAPETVKMVQVHKTDKWDMCKAGWLNLNDKLDTEGSDSSVLRSKRTKLPFLTLEEPATERKALYTRQIVLEKQLVTKSFGDGAVVDARISKSIDPSYRDESMGNSLREAFRKFAKGRSKYPETLSAVEVTIKGEVELFAEDWTQRKELGYLVARMDIRIPDREAGSSKSSAQHRRKRTGASSTGSSSTKGQRRLEPKSGKKIEKS